MERPKASVYDAPDEYAEMILAYMRVLTSSADMIKCAEANMDTINVLKRIAPVRVTHMRNLIKLAQQREAKK